MKAARGDRHRELVESQFPEGRHAAM
jgi:hypothetical protein